MAKKPQTAPVDQSPVAVDTTIASESQTAEQAAAPAPAPAPAPSPKPAKPAKPAPAPKPAKPAKRVPDIMSTDQLPKKLAGNVTIYQLMAAPRAVCTEPRSEHRRFESGTRLVNQYLVGTAFNKAALLEPKATYAKQHPNLYFWIAEIKVIGDMPSNMQRAIAIEQVIAAFA